MTWAGTEKANPTPLSGADVIRLAERSGLSWVELPPRMLGDLDPEALRALRRTAEARGIRFVVPGGRVAAEDLRHHLAIAAELGAPTVRCTLSSILCGDRRKLDGGWRAHLQACQDELAAVLPEAERLQVAIAVENHQDADSYELLALCERFDSRYLGITLDCGNPLAVMEDPIEFATRVARYLRHVHLKDYRIYPAPNGFRLCRCALGEGAVDYAALFALFDAQEWPITRNIEMGALQARQIPMLERSWWDEFEPRDARTVVPVLSLLQQHLRPAAEEWRTPFELDASGSELAEYEWSQYHTSIAYLQRTYGTVSDPSGA
jgi:sugar phosphate isomerase/epimerase